MIATRFKQCTGRLAATTLLWSTSTIAFTPYTGRSFSYASRSAFSLTPSQAPKFGRVSTATTTTTSLSLFGELQKFFLTGSAYDTQIDYSKLPHPGPELAALAQANEVLTHSVQDPNLSVATFAGGCFWGLELAYQRLPGVVHTAVGYTQGAEKFPTYDQVCAGNTGHTEAVIVYYDPTGCTYRELLEVFFKRVNPTTVNGQGRDYGRQYRTGVYVHTPEQDGVARDYFESVKLQYNRPIATELKFATPFWPAETYHQQYLEKGGRFGQPQSADKGATEEIRCYG